MNDGWTIALGLYVLGIPVTGVMLWKVRGGDSKMNGPETAICLVWPIAMLALGLVAALQSIWRDA